MESEDDSSAQQTDLDILSPLETGGIWSSTPQSVKWYMWQAPKRQFRLITYYMDRFWSLFHMPGISWLISPVVSPGIPILTVANQTLGFIRRNIKTKVREAAYNSIVRPKNMLRLSGIRTRRCKYPKSNKSSDGGWRSLEQRRADARLCLFYKVIHGLVAVPLPDYIHYSNLGSEL